jgi:hypothetical protein
LLFVCGSADHVAAGSGSTVDGSVSGSDVTQESSEHGSISDTLNPEIRGDAGDHEAVFGGISTTRGLGIGGEFQTTVAGVLDGSDHGFGIVDSAAEETSTFSGSSSEAYSEISSTSGVSSVSSSDFGSHTVTESQLGVSGSGSSFSPSHSSSGPEMKDRKKLPVGVKG